MGEFQPRWFGDYELLRLLGVGGMAEVYLARATKAHGFSKIVVVKRMLDRLRDQPRFIEMFIGEAKRAVLLQHANIVQILSLEEHQGWPFIVMEHVHGKNLHQVIKAAVKEKVELPIDFGIHCVAELLKGLTYAHEAMGPDGKPLNLVHRDITPENVFISFSGEVKLGDFGVAHSAGAIKPRQLRGKLGYLAPEGLSELPVDQRADIFSTGVVLWEVLAQRRLYPGKGPEVLKKILNNTPPPPSQVNPKVAPDLDRIVAKALAHDREQRFSSANAFEEALSDYLFARGLRWTRRRIAEVMQARHPADVEPPELPPELPRPSEEAGALSDPADFSDASAGVMVQALSGAMSSDMSVVTEDSDKRLLTTLDSEISHDEEGIPIDEDFDEFSTEIERVMVGLRSLDVPVPLSLQGLCDNVNAAPDDLESVFQNGKPPVSREALAELLYWDVLRDFPALPPEPSSQDSFEAMSPTRLLYEVSVRRLTGSLLLEDPPTQRRRLLLLRDGSPLYVYSNDPRQGLLPMFLRYRLVDPVLLFRGVTKVLAERRTLDDGLADALRVQGQADAIATVHGWVSSLLMRRLLACFSWQTGRYLAYGDLVSSSPYNKPLPSILGYLLSAARHAYTREGLYAKLSGRGANAVVISPDRESHVAALRPSPIEQRLIDSIDGRRSLPQLVLGAGASGPEEQHRALALLYTLAETRIAELF